MMRPIAILAFLASLSAFAKPPSAPVVVHNGFLTGSTYRELAGAERRAYVMGVVDGYMLAPVFGADSNDLMKGLGKCVEGIRNDQLVAIVDQYIANKPAEWDRNMHTLVYGALMRACADRGYPFR